MDQELYVKIQPKLLDLYRECPVYIQRADSSNYIRFLHRGNRYRDAAIKKLISEDVNVFAKLSDHKKCSKCVEEKLITLLKGELDYEKSGLVKEYTIQLLDEYFAEIKSKSKVEVDEENTERLHTIAVQYVDLCSRDRKFLNMLHEYTIKDTTTASHSVNVMVLMLMFLTRNKKYIKVGEQKRNEEELLKSWTLGALFHDLGKIKIPDEILKAKRKLTSEEFDLMKMHVYFGMDMLRSMYPALKDDVIIRKCIQDHHERLDGHGYPHQIKGVSLPGRILGLVDCFEALTTFRRPYREAATPFEALQIAKKEVDMGKFDKDVFVGLVNVVSEAGHDVASRVEGGTACVGDTARI